MYLDDDEVWVEAMTDGFEGSGRGMELYEIVRREIVPRHEDVF